MELRTDMKKRAILDAARETFLAQGFAGTTMDQIAARAMVSKQTVYKQFTDKEQLFAQIILDTMGDTVGAMIEGAAVALRTDDGVESDLVELAESFIRAIWQPQVLRLRRVVIGEAARFPELGAAYFEQGFSGGLTALAAGLQQLADRGALRLDDARAAAGHLAGLMLWVPMHRAMFTGDDSALPPAEVTRIATSGVRVFLAAYSPVGVARGGA